MVEMLGVLAIIGVLSVGGIAGYSKAMEQYRINKTIDIINQIVINTQILYMQQKNYTGLNTSSALAAGIFPDDRVELPLGQSANVSIKSSNNGRFFGLRISGLNGKQCAKLVARDWRGYNENGLYAVSIRLAHDLLGSSVLGDDNTGSSVCSTPINSNTKLYCAADGKKYNISQCCYPGLWG